jgi:HD-GYP domain-containing protein (c-di-GMP phosphodiesterase class II)
VAPIFGEAQTIEEQLRSMHAQLRAELPGVSRIAVAVYDLPSDDLKTFVHSTEGASPFTHYIDKLANVPALAELARTRRDRIIGDLADDLWSSSHRRALVEHGFRSSYTTPFYDHGKLVGFVFFDCFEQGYFTPPRMRHVELYAHLVALLVIDSLRRASVLRSAVAVAKHFGHRRDEETGAHLDRMAYYSRLVADALSTTLGFDDEFIEFVFLFAPLHDIGKIAIPDEILLKRGRLTVDEFTTMKTHVSEGAGMVDAIVDSFGIGASQHVDVLRNIVRFHHEWYDGSGYLQGLAGAAIPVEARIVAVADVFDALTTERPYKSARSNEAAFAYLGAHAGGHFDPLCVEALLGNRAEARRIQRRFRAEAGFHEAYEIDGV